MGTEPRAIDAAWKAALRVVYPPQCPCCDAPVAGEGALCPDCWREAGFLAAGRVCGKCSAPLAGGGDADLAVGAEGLVCDECLAIPRPWSRGVAALRYAGSGRRMVLALKHGDRPDLARVLGGWLAAAARPVVGPETLVVPVPLHPRRLLRRRYNQAALLAAAAARGLGLAHRPAALRRVRHTPMQDHRTLPDRFANQEGAFAVAAREAPRLAGRAVLLVDDVMASGATLAAAAEALAGAGVARIDVAVVARATKDD